MSERIGEGEPATTPAAAASLATGWPVFARIPYLNAQPYYVGWETIPGTSLDLVPRRLGEEARAGRVDGGLMAVVDFFGLASDFERVGSLGIACRGPVGSVLLLARAPVAELGGSIVRLTSDSSTSAALVRLLLEDRHGLRDLRYERAALPLPATPPEGEAWLVIGDAALASRRAAPGNVALDLGEAWTEWTGLPFTYAVWAVRKSLPEEARRGLASFLEGALGRGERELARLGAEYAARTAGALGPPEDLTRYLERFTYRLGRAEEEGLSAFHTLWQRASALEVRA